MILNYPLLPSTNFQYEDWCLLLIFVITPGLNSLPESRGEGVRMGGLLLDNCGFTSIPKIAQGRLRTLTLANNKITSVSANELNALSSALDILI